VKLSPEVQAQIQTFKQYRIDKPPAEIVLHYQKELQAIQDTLDIISGGWKMQIIALLCNSEFRFSEIEKGLPSITAKVLSNSLKDLVQNKLVIRNSQNNSERKVSYKLSDYGYTLVPLIIELTNWGVNHREYLRNGPIAQKHDSKSP
jgi:DNA-binding HxlR family transcriptional regulator